MPTTPGPRPADEPSSAPQLRVAVVHELTDDARLLAQWDELACAAGAPRSAPACVMAWYRHVLADNRRIRLITVHDGDRLVGVHPLFVHRDRWGFAHYRMAGHGTIAGVEHLFAREQQEAAARAIAGSLHRLDPVPDAVEVDAVPRARAFLELAADAWPRPRPEIRSWASVAPFLVLPDGGYEAWLDSRSGRTTRLARRSERLLVEAGYRPLVLEEPGEILDRLPALRELYLERKEDRGGAGADFGPPMVAMVEDLVRRLAPLGRATIFTWERDDVVLTAHLVLSAGGNASGWLGAVGSREAKLSPGSLNLVANIEWAQRSGTRTLDWGPGNEAYKNRFSNGARALQDAFLRRRNLFLINTPVARGPRRARALAGSLRNRLRRRA